MSGNVGKWQSSLTTKQILEFESIAWRSMIELGYKPHIVHKIEDCKRFDADSISELNATNAMLKQEVADRLPESDKLARSPQDALLLDIRVKSEALLSP